MTHWVCLQHRMHHTTRKSRVTPKKWIRKIPMPVPRKQYIFLYTSLSFLRKNEQTGTDTWTFNQKPGGLIPIASSTVDNGSVPSNKLGREYMLWVTEGKEQNKEEKTVTFKPLSHCYHCQPKASCKEKEASSQDLHVTLLKSWSDV